MDCRRTLRRHKGCGSRHLAAHVHEHNLHGRTERRIQYPRKHGYCPTEPNLHRPPQHAGQLHLYRALRLYRKSGKRLPLHQHLLTHHEHNPEQLRRQGDWRRRLQGHVCSKCQQKARRRFQIRLQVWQRIL